MKKTFLIIGFISVALGVNAQKSYDYGLFLGVTEAHQYTILPFPDANGFSYVAGGYYRYSMNARYAWRVGANTSFDPKNSFRPNMLEGFGLFEFNFLPLSTKREKERVSPYIDVGLSYLVDLPLMATIPLIENTTMREYMFRNIRIPFNVGVRYLVSSNMTIGIEWALRKGRMLDYSRKPEPSPTDPEPKIRFTPLTANWRSHIGFTIGYMVSNYCRTCPFYENERKKLK